MNKSGTKAVGTGSDLHNFLFFLNDFHPLSVEDSLIGALASPAAWPAVKELIGKARKNGTVARSIDSLQIYLHVPFCGRLCSFCHCAKSLLRRRTEIDEYLKNLDRQMSFFASAYEGMTADTLSFGGGTPSVLDVDQLNAVLDIADRIFPCEDRKLLFEINPSSWSAAKLSLLMERGLYRLSIGVQTLQESVLHGVNRWQTKEKVIWCIRSAVRKGVECINVDLMAGLPGQTRQGFVADLKCLIAEGANVVHVHPYCSQSLKTLCAPGEKPGDFFKRRDGMMRVAAEILTANGFKRSGIRAYAKNDKGEEHQEKAYVKLESAVAGFGPSAKGQFPGGVYYHAVDYLYGNDFSKTWAVPQNDRYAAAHFAILSMLDGLDARDFHKRFGLMLEDDFADGLRVLRDAGLIERDRNIWRFSAEWEVSRIRQYIALSRSLFGLEFLDQLRYRMRDRYDPRVDYSHGDALLKAYANSWIMSLYYQMGI